MVTGCVGEMAVVTSTVPGTEPSAVSVTVHDAPAGSGVMTSGSSAAPAGYVTDPTVTPSHAASIVTGPRRLAPSPVTTFLMTSPPGLNVYVFVTVAVAGPA